VAGATSVGAKPVCRGMLPAVSRSCQMYSDRNREGLRLSANQDMAVDGQRIRSVYRGLTGEWIEKI
jgi:hypothetical protein